MTLRARPLPALVLALCAAGCGTPPPDDSGGALRLLSEYKLFAPPLAAQVPAAGVVPFDVNAELYADGAGKLRFIALPQGKKIGFDKAERWSWPDGTIIAKTFFYDHDARAPKAGRRILETRLLILKEGVWTVQVYRWNDAQTEAERFVAGETVQITRLDAQGLTATGEYRIPATSACKGCHGQDKKLVPLGPRTRQLNRDSDFGAGPENQLLHFAKLGMFESDPPPPALLEKLADPAGPAPVAVRARAYLDANCAHCHNDQGYAAATSLRLNLETTLPVDLGACRHPVAAGHANGGFLYDVVPGNPEESIMIFRMKSNNPEIKMPQLPLTTSDPLGVEVVSGWIKGLAPVDCK